MSSYTSYSWIAAFALCAAFVLPQASAYATSEKDALFIPSQRVPDDFVPQGMTAGSFLILPKLITDFTYDTNVFSTDGGEQGDYIVSVKPSVEVRKFFGPHKFALQTGGEFHRYASNTDENAENYFVRPSISLSANRSLGFTAEGIFSRRAIPRSTPGETSFTRAPVDVSRKGVTLGANYTFNRLNLELLGGFSRVQYSDGESRQTGQPIIFGDENFKEQRYTLNTSYDILGDDIDLPEHVLFTELSYASQKFDETADVNGTISAQQRNNDEIGFLAGFKTRYKNLITGRAAVGYFYRDFEQNDNVGQLDFDINMSANITPKTTLFLEGERTINQDNSFETGIVSTNLEFKAEHEFLHNLYGGGFAGYRLSDFTGSSEGREDDNYSLGVNARYLHSPYFTSKASIERFIRESNRPGNDLEQYLFMYSLTTQY